MREKDFKKENLRKHARKTAGTRMHTRTQEHTSAHSQTQISTYTDLVGKNTISHFNTNVFLSAFLSESLKMSLHVMEEERAHVSIDRGKKALDRDTKISKKQEKKDKA